MRADAANQQILAERVRFALLLVVPSLIIVAGTIYTQFRTQDRGFDDAYISFRYAQNLVEGHGLVFNPGERVEGFSNLLYTLVAALGIALFGPDNVYVYSLVVNTLLLVLTLVFFAGVVRQHCSPLLTFGACIVFAAYFQFWWAVWSAMETSLVLFSFVLAWSAFVRYARRPRRRWLVQAAVAAALVLLARADGFVIVFITLVWAALHRRRREFLWVGVPASIVFFAIISWRLAYYGLPLPNTYYVKVTGDLPDRLRYAFNEIQRFRPLMPYLIVLAAALIPAALATARAGPRRPAIPFEPFFAVSWVAYWFYVGGDIFGMRFLLILVPLGLYTLVRYVALVPKGPLRTGLAMSLVSALLIIGFLPDLHARQTIFDRKTDPWAELGEALDDAPPDTVIAVDAAGKIPYFSELTAIDMYGLTDRMVAESDPGRFVPGHSKVNREYIVTREPDLVITHLDLELNTPVFLKRENYLRRGYKLAYMLYLGAENPEHGSLIDVRGLAPKLKERWCIRGYTYGILSKVDLDLPDAYPAAQYSRS